MALHAKVRIEHEGALVAQIWGNWAHVIINTHGSWLPGEPMGFRNRNHRIHSSGDVDHPPPPSEHEGLLRYSHSRSRGAVCIPASQRRPIAVAIAEKLHALNRRVRIISVSASHAHILADVGPDDAKPLVGKVKQAASHRVRDALPGKIWSDGCHVERVHDEARYRNTVIYIAAHEDEGAAIWVPPKLRTATAPSS